MHASDPCSGQLRDESFSFRTPHFSSLLFPWNPNPSLFRLISSGFHLPGCRVQFAFLVPFSTRKTRRRRRYMGLPTTELCLGSRPVSVSFRTLASRAEMEDLVECLEKEMRKIESFRRELPLCLRIVTQVVDALKEELVRCEDEGGRAVHHPILEQFLPVSRSRFQKEDEKKENKMQWMSSIQLWSSDGDGVRDTDSDSRNKGFVIEGVAKFAKNGKEFPSFRGIPEPPEKEVKKVTVPLADISLVTPGIDGSDVVSSLPKEHRPCPLSVKSKPLVGSLFSSPNAPANSHGQAQQQNATKKARRCWSPELHRKFVGVLEQLGGSHVATPKQIREMMMVDGLTNDEVKSHLQKYRLHIQKVHPSSALANEPEGCGVGLGMINCTPLMSSSS